MAKRGLEFEADLVPAGAKVYYLDLIKYRDLSNNIAERWQVRHESPQLLVLEGAKCIYHASHGEIDMVTACAFLD
jgi:bacillithiol system protein YtxJ